MANLSPLDEITRKAGAVFSEEGGWLMPAHFGDSAAECQQAHTAAALFDLSHRGLIELTGPEAAAFLHNLCTNDIKNLASGQGCAAFLCTAKAKVVASLWVFRQGGSFWLDLDPGLADRVAGHLDHFLISEQVEIANHSGQFAQLHLAGPAAATLVEKIAGTAQVRPHDRLGLPGFDLLTAPAKAAELWSLLSAAGAQPAGLQALDILRVEAGLPVYGRDIDAERFVVEVGQKDAICYTKGCYLGQEPIVMARDRGHVNRMLRGLRLGADVVLPSAKVHRDGAEVGQVTSVVHSPTLGPIALAYLRRGSWDAGILVEVEAATGRVKAEVVTLPFAGGGASLP
jgi:folate-binding protein YgfZ